MVKCPRKGVSNVSIYREESMITLARNRKGLGTEKWEMEGREEVWQDNCSLQERCRVKAFLSWISVCNACFSDQWKREVNISSTYH